jgi:hypothetical protein
MLKNILRHAQAFRQLADDLLVHLPIRRQRREKVELERLDRRFAAHAATRCRVAISLEPLEVEADAGTQRHPHAMLETLNSESRPAALNRVHLIRRPEQPFADEKPYRQFPVMPGRAHRDRDRLRLPCVCRPEKDLNFQRLLEGDIIGTSLPLRFREPPYWMAQE